MDLIICDPPFGIKETSFDKHYNRNNSNIIDGYQESPEDYHDFSSKWITEAKRVLKPNGSMYIVSGWTNLKDILNVISDLDLFVINHIIWKYNFGVFTKKKFISSHYHILYLKKNAKSKPKFNVNCRFGFMEKTESDHSLLNTDLEDVWFITKEYMPGIVKNSNKLPDELLRKIILYSSSIGDTVCDFFLGNFTTAYIAKKLYRIPFGFEINKNSFDYHIDKLKEIKLGCDLETLKKVEDDAPKNQGKKISLEEKSNIIASFLAEVKNGSTKKDAIAKLCKKHDRGRFSILNIVKDYKPHGNI
jgi:site-specific DNA-methyltransferase (adenine-specific)